jgi:hypothetical protein
MAEFEEIGVSGINLYSGRSYDEYLPELRGERGLRTLRAMRDNDPISGAMLTAVENLIRAATFSVLPADSSEDAKEAAAFVDDVFESMSDGYTWDDILSEASSQFTYGWCDHEVIYKRRDDGRIGLARLGIRVQETIDKYELDSNNIIQGIWQQPNEGGYYFIPISKAIHWQTTNSRGNPYGRSLLRNSYRSYYYKQEIEEIEAIAASRELNGLPVIKVPNALLTEAANGDSSAQQTLEEYRKIARDLRFNSQAGVILPSDPFQNTSDANLQYSNNLKVDLQLLSASGTRNIDTSSVIKRYASDQARSILADWLLLGSDSRGSYALSESKSDAFTQSIKAHSNRIADTLNKQLIPKLWAINGFDASVMPKIVVSEIAPMNLDTLANYVKSVAGAGIMFGDEEEQEWLKSQAGIPTSDEGMAPEISDQNDEGVEEPGAG